MVDCVNPSMSYQEITLLVCVPEIFSSGHDRKDSYPDFGFPCGLYFSVLPSKRMGN
jgi:hypothetical protein